MIRHTAIKSAAAATPTIHQPPSQQTVRHGVPRATVFVYLKNLFNNTSEVSKEPAPRSELSQLGGH